jgi:DNA (cytosine-5)-methyltransferase 1
MILWQPARVLDLFCGAGGAAMGLHRAWPEAEITGVDIRPMPRYPFRFIQADAMIFPLDGYDFIWASPPCQRYSIATPNAYRMRHPDLIANIRERLRKNGKPFVIENVPGARSILRETLMLCGSMFGLGIWRHRYFEMWPSEIAILTPPCNHSNIPVLISGTRRRNNDRSEFTAQQCREASGLDWMIRTEMDQAIPPAYSEYIARQLSETLNR